MLPVYYLGPEGTFSHILARKRFGRAADLRRCATIESVVDAVVGDSGALGLLPVENSSGGTIHDSIDVLIRHAGNIGVIEELALDVRIALLRNGSGRLRVVFSHFTQIKHHAQWLKSRFPEARTVAVESTALAAKKAAASAGAAALASPGAAEVYGLEVAGRPPSLGLANVTHFYVIRAGAPVGPPRGERTRTALVVALPNVCGSLHSFLAPFARHRISLTRIVSRPVAGRPQTYVFFVEIEGDPRMPAAARALERARSLAESMTPLGSFPCGRRYKS